MWTLTLLILSLALKTAFQQELRPNAPNVSTVVVSCEKVRVLWSAVSLNGVQLDNYTVFYKAVSDSEETRVTATGLQTTLSQLIHTTTYQIRVAAISLDTVGDKSLEVQATTFGAIQATNLQVYNVTNHSAVFSWEIDGPNMGCNGKPITAAFRVRYRQIGSSSTLRKINTRNQIVELNNLLPFRNYTAYVVTSDPSGPNIASSNLLFTSLPGVPSVPLNVTAITNNSIPTQLFITWQEPLTPNGIISHYHIELGEQGSSSQQQSNVQELLLTGLKPSGIYHVRVRANNYARLNQNISDVIPGPFSEAVTVHLPDPLPVAPGRPTQFTVNSEVLYGSKVELLFSWKPPLTGDPAHSYSIMCNTTDVDGTSLHNPLSIRIMLPTLLLKAKFDAMPYVAYHCDIYASNNVGDGPRSEDVSVSPVPLASSPVRRLSAMPLNYSHVKLSWNKPRSRSDYITSYIVTIKHPSSGNITSMEVVNNVTSLTVKGLTGNAAYSFSVIAVSMFEGKRLDSNATNASIVTPTGSPSHPRDVTIEVVSNATVQIHWSPPIQTNGDITRYKIDAEVQSVYNTENGQRQFTESYKTTTKGLHHSIPLLTPGSIYSVNITAFTTSGPGPTATMNVSLDDGRNDAITYFQLKLRQFSDCTKAQDTDTKAHIRNQLVRRLEEACACVLHHNTITDIQTQCNTEGLNYIGRIVGTEQLRPLVLFNLLVDWSNRNTSVIRVSGESFVMDQNCPLYLSSPSDLLCVPLVSTTSTSTPEPTRISPLPTSSETTRTPVLPTATNTAKKIQENSDDSINTPILVGCFIGGVILGCFITLFILVVVFCCRIKRRQKVITEEAIYARPSRRNKRIRITSNDEKDPLHMQACPAYSLDKESDYAIPRKRTGSIDSVDLQLYRTDSKQRGINNPIPSTPPLPPAYHYNVPNLYSSPVNQAFSLDNLSSYTGGRPVNARKESLYQSPRTPSFSVDELLNGIPSQRFSHRTSSPLQKSTRRPVNGAVNPIPSPISSPKFPEGVYDDPRRPSVTVGNNIYDRPSSNAVLMASNGIYDDPRKASVTVGINNYDSPPSSALPKIPSDTYDDPRRPSIRVDNSIHLSPSKTHDYTQLETPTKPSLEGDKDDPDYSYVE